MLRQRFQNPIHRSLSLALLLAACAPSDVPQEQASETSSTTPATAVETAEPEPEDEPFVRTAWLEAESFVHPFGDVYAQSLHRVTFEATAAGDVPLVLRELKYSCGCTAGELFVLGEDEERSPVVFGEPYPQGTRFELDASLNTLGRSGPQEQKLMAVLEDGSLDTFIMEANIEPFLVAEPTNLRWEGVDPTKGAEATFRLTAKNGESFTPTVWRKILGESLEITLVPDELDDSGRSTGWTGRVALLPGLGGETLRSKFILHADVPNLEAAPNPDGTPAMQRLEFPVVAQIDPLVKAIPERFNLGRLGPDAEVQNRTLLRSKAEGLDLRDAVVRLIDARGKNDFPYADYVQVEVVPREDPSELELVLVTRSLPGEGNFAGRIRVELDHPLQRVVEIPFKGVATR